MFIIISILLLLFIIVFGLLYIYIIYICDILCVLKKGHDLRIFQDVLGCFWWIHDFHFTRLTRPKSYAKNLETM